MQNKALKVIVGLIGFGLVAVFLFTAVSKSSLLDFAKSGIVLLVTLQLISKLGKKTTVSPEASTASKRNVKLVAIGLSIGLLLPLVLLWFITQSVR